MSGRRRVTLRARHRLFWQIYFGFVAVVVVFALLAASGWWLFDESDDESAKLEVVAEILSGGLPGPDAPPGELEGTLKRIGSRFEGRLSVYGADGAHLASSGNPVRLPRRHRGAGPGFEQGVFHGRRGHGLALQLPDGRWVVGRPNASRKLGLLKALGLLALAIGLGAWPLARRIVRRLEGLHAGVQSFGSGDLSARVAVQGRDEVAALATAFNQAAERIERLVDAQRSTLAGASHELRSPLARMRLSLELLAQGPRPQLLRQLESDIAELDALIAELLIASRLQAGTHSNAFEPVDLLALAAEEGARVDATLSGEAVVIEGDLRLLARALRNLFENAQRHGEGSPIECSVGRTAEAEALVVVSDDGPGIAPEERERIFEPFYRPRGTTEDGRGVGLGLALVRQIARRHGGDVRCVQPDGGGSRFELRLAGVRDSQPAD
ncbi:MAG: HAMP domain-containing sensor histidine kinase [Gammaproteobacteria bacterium]